MPQRRGPARPEAARAAHDGQDDHTGHLTGLSDPQSFLDLADYRRRVAGLYAWVRGHYAASPARAHARWRRERDSLFRTHPQSAVPAAERRAFGGLRYFPYDPQLAFAARLEPAPTLAAHGAGASPFVPAGIVRLPIGDLEVYWLNAYAGGLFLPFRDATSGAETYGGGRYLLDTAKAADLGADAKGRLILDFNFAYHPSCVFDPRWPCPLAPAANWLKVPVRAGERLSPGP